MDFMSDQLMDSRSLRTFNIIDDYNRDGLGIEVDLSLPSARVVRALEQIVNGAANLRRFVVTMGWSTLHKPWSNGQTASRLR